MAKDNKFYFSHDYNARNDRKIALLVKDFKAAGYGIYWCTAEMMHEEGGSLDFDEITFAAISKDLNESVEAIEAVLQACVAKYKLFLFDENQITAKRVRENLTEYISKKNVKIEAGRKGGIKSGESRRSEKKIPEITKQNEAVLQAERSTLEANEPNEIKLKEIKGNNINTSYTMEYPGTQFQMGEIYIKSWEEYRKILNGQAKLLSEEIFSEWKEFVDFVSENDLSELYACKFINPIDFGKLKKETSFPKEIWLSVLKKILSTGVKPEHNLYFRIPEFIGYAMKNQQPKLVDPTKVKIKL